MLIALGLEGTRIVHIALCPEMVPDGMVVVDSENCPKEDLLLYDYIDGEFIKNEAYVQAISTADQTIAELDAAVVDLTYQNILLELGV